MREVPSSIPGRARRCYFSYSRDSILRTFLIDVKSPNNIMNIICTHILQIPYFILKCQDITVLQTYGLVIESYLDINRKFLQNK